MSRQTPPSTLAHRAARAAENAVEGPKMAYVALLFALALPEEPVESVLVATSPEALDVAVKGFFNEIREAFCEEDEDPESYYRVERMTTPIHGGKTL